MRTRLALVAVPAVLALGLAACGDAEPEAASDTLPVIRLSTAARSAGSSAEMSAADDAVGTKMIAANWEYVLTGELADLPGEGAAWSFPANSSPVDAAEVARIAAVFGLTGDVVEVPTDEGGGSRVGPSDGTAPSLYVGTDGLRSWYYNAPWPAGVACTEVGVEPGSPLTEEERKRLDEQAATVVDPGTVVDPATSGPAAGEVPDSGDPSESDPATTFLPASCPAPEPPAGVPTEDEARASATDLLTALGLDPAAFELEVYADSWSANVTAHPSLGGIRSPLALGFGFGAEGAVQYASGFLAQATPAGTYPLIGVEAGFARLQEGFGWGGWAPLGADAARSAVAPDTAVVPDTSVAVEPADVVSSMVDPAAPACLDTAAASEPAADDTAPADVTIEPMPCEPYVPETVTVNIVSVETDLWQIWDVDGTIWLLPAYRFVDDQGGWHTVPAVADEYLQYEEQSGDDVVGDAEPAIATTPSDDAASTASAPIASR